METPAQPAVVVEVEASPKVEDPIEENKGSPGHKQIDGQEEVKIQWPTKDELPDNCVVFGKLPLQTTEATIKIGISLIAEGVVIEKMELYNDKRSVIQEKIANVFLGNMKRVEFLEKIKGKFMKIINKDFEFNQPFYIKIVAEDDEIKNIKYY